VKLKQAKDNQHRVKGEKNEGGKRGRGRGEGEKIKTLQQEKGCLCLFLKEHIV